MKNTSINSYGSITIAAMAVFGAVLFAAPSISAAAYNYSYYNPNYYGTPSYNYYQYQAAPMQAPVYASVQASCYPSTVSTYTGNSVTWTVSMYGGNGSSYVSWSGDEALSGYGTAISKIYYTPGYKSASATVSSGGQTVTINCNGSVNVIGNSSYNSNYYYNNQQPYYNTNTSYYNTQPYYNSNTSYYTAPVAYPTQPLSSNANGLDIGCYSSPSTVTVNQPVTWNVEVTGGVAPYAYSWTGSDGLTGTGISVIKYYDTSGQKDAIVTVTSADGRTGTMACTNELAVSNGGTARTYAYVRPTQQPTTKSAEQNANTQLSAVSMFSLQNVPWGWVAILIILVLFFSVLYLLFNRTKI